MLQTVSSFAATGGKGGRGGKVVETGWKMTSEVVNGGSGGKCGEAMVRIKVVVVAVFSF